MNITIDNIKNRYKFEYNPNELNCYEDAKDILITNNTKVWESFHGYNYYSRLKELNGSLKLKENRLKENEFKLYKNKINDFIVQVENIEEQILDERLKYLALFYNFKIKYEENNHFPEAFNICKNIFKELLNQIFELCINYEKKFLFLNDLIIDLNNKLNF